MILPQPHHPKKRNRQKHLPLLSLAGAALLISHSAQAQSNNYTILDGKKIGTVSVEKNILTYTAPAGKKIAAADEAFLTPTMDWRPSGPITCSWSPDNQYVAIITPHPRTSVISLVNLKTQELLKETFPSNPPYPTWYQNVRATKDRPVKWDGSSLLLKTSVTLPGQIVREMPQVLRITGKTFSITPVNPETPKNTPRTGNPASEKKHSIEW